VLQKHQNAIKSRVGYSILKTPILYQWTTNFFVNQCKVKITITPIPKISGKDPSVKEFLNSIDNCSSPVQSMESLGKLNPRRGQNKVLGLAHI
jgi:hypothetical protein